MRKRNVIADFGQKISKEEYETYDGLCWECWDDQMKKNAKLKKT